MAEITIDSITDQSGTDIVGYSGGNLHGFECTQVASPSHKKTDCVSVSSQSLRLSDRGQNDSGEACGDHFTNSVSPGGPDAGAGDLIIDVGGPRPDSRHQPCNVTVDIGSPRPEQRSLPRNSIERFWFWLKYHFRRFRARAGVGCVTRLFDHLRILFARILLPGWHRRAETCDDRTPLADPDQRQLESGTRNSSQENTALEDAHAEPENPTVDLERQAEVGPDAVEEEEEPTFWFDHGIEPFHVQRNRQVYGVNGATQAQLMRSHMGLWFPFSCPCGKRSRGLARLEAARVKVELLVARRIDTENARASRGDPSCVELGVATLGGNSVGGVTVRPGITGAEVKSQVARIVGAPIKEVELVLAGKREPVSNEQVILNGREDIQALKAAPKPHLHMLRIRRCYAITGSSDGNVRLWDVNQKELLSDLGSHRRRVQCVAADFKSQFALTGSSDGTMKLWDVSSSSCAETIIDYMGDFNSVAVDWRNHLALGALSNGTLSMWNLRTGDCIQALHGGHHGPAQCVDVAWSRRRALSGSTDGGVMLWDLDRSTCAPTQGHMVWVSDIKVDPEFAYAVSGSIDGMLRVWDFRTNRCARTLRGGWNDVKCLSVDWSTGAVLTGAAGGCVKLWDIGAGAMVAVATSNRSHRDTNCLSVDWAAQQAVSGSASGHASLWNLETFECKESWSAHEFHVKAVCMQSS